MIKEHLSFRGCLSLCSGSIQADSHEPEINRIVRATKATPYGFGSKNSYSGNSPIGNNTQVRIGECLFGI